MRHLPLSAAFFRKISVLLLTASALLRCSESRAQGCDFTFQPANPCPGEAVTFSVTTPQGGHIYIWKFGNLPGVQVGNTVSATFPNHFIVAGQNHQVILKDSVGGMVVCADTMTINVKPGPDPSLTLPVPNPPGLSIDGDVISACGVLPPVSVPVRNNSSTLSFNAGYLLDWGDGSAPLSNFPPNPPSSHTYNTEGFFPIKLTVTRNNGCVLSKTYTFFNGNVPAIGNKTDQLPQNICAPFDYKFDILNTSTNSSGTLYSIVVNGQVIETFTQQDVPSSYTCHFLASSCGEFDPGTGLKNVYAVSIIAENPCDKQISGVGQVKVNGPPTPFIGVSHTNPNCPPVTYTFSDKSIGGGKILPSGNCDSTRADAVWHLSGMPGVDWDLVSGDTLGAAQIRVRYKKPGTYFINMVAANNGNCGTADTTISVTILTPPTIAASVQLPPSNCLPMTVQGSSVAMGQGVTTIWTVTPPPGLPPSCYTINNPNSPNTSITLLCPGTYGIRVRAVNACDDAEWSTTVEVKSKPTLSFTLPSTCEGQPLTLKANNIGLADGGLPVSITWDFPGGSPASVTLPYPQLPAGVVYPGSGPYTISAVAANDCGTATATATVSFGKKPAPAFALSLNPMSGCAPVTAAATDQSQLNAPAATLRRWTLSNTATGGIVSTSSALNPTFPSLPQGQYLLRLELGNSCDTLLAEKTFVVYGKPTLDFKPILNQPCGSGSPLLSFTRTTGGLPLTYSWQFPGATPATS
ncbi:MAG TPA: hypothetical protein PK971_03855, partial [Saprospiraceae bacterium]|nr:hypothetical protein [Saprospiraceae bacterium]